MVQVDDGVSTEQRKYQNFQIRIYQEHRVDSEMQHYNSFVPLPIEIHVLVVVCESLLALHLLKTRKIIIQLCWHQILDILLEIEKIKV